MKINRKTLSSLVSRVSDCASAEEYAAALVSSNVWESEFQAPSSKTEVDLLFRRLARLYSVVNLPMKDIIRTANLTQKAFACLFCLPLRTVENWCAAPSSPNHRVPLFALKLLLIESLGLLPFEIEPNPNK